MTRPDARVHLLLSRARSGESVLEDGVDGARAGTAPLPEALPKPPDLWRTWADPGDLRLQRWGVIAPEGPEGDRLIAAIEPLIARRRAQQGGQPIKMYRVPPTMDLAEAARWKKRHFNPAGDLEVELPRYQLILGDLDQVPLAVQQVQSTDGMVGRLAFDDDDGYAGYVSKVLCWEDERAATEDGDAILYTVQDRTRATRMGHSALMSPGVDILDRWHERGVVRAAEIRAAGSADPSPDELFHLGRTQRPTVLFSMSHGEGAPAGGWLSPDEQRREQGAMSFGRGGRVTAEDLSTGAFLPGGVWLMFACFGAGTPASSAYRPWLEVLVAAGHQGPEILEAAEDSLALANRPFIAALPKAVLANPDGPLAFIGHVDLAWTHSYLDVDDPDGRPTRRPGRFMSSVQAMLGGSRIGLGFRALGRYLTEVDTELTALHARDRAASPGQPGGPGDRPLDPATAAQRAHLWMLRQDLAAYVLLGDPAAALPLRQNRGAAADPASSPDPPADAERIARQEKAIGKVLSRQFTLQRVAREARMEVDELERLVEAYRRGGRAALRDLE